MGTPLRGRAGLGMGPGLLRRCLGLAAVCRTTARAAVTARTRRQLGATAAWWLLAAWSCPAGCSADIASERTTPEAEVLAVGHGLAVVIQTPDGQTLLYDCGRLGDPTVGRRIIAPALWARGVSRIDAVFLSHADQDHYNGLPDLLDRFPIGTCASRPGFAGAANPPAIELIDQFGPRHPGPADHGARSRGKPAGVRFTVRHPPAGWYPETSDNARSLVLDVAYAGRHLLLTGDLEQPGLDRADGAAAPRAAAGRHLGPAPRRQDGQPGLALRVGQTPDRRRQPAPSARHGQRRPAAARTPGNSRPADLAHGAIRLRWTADGIVASGFLDR